MLGRTYAPANVHLHFTTTGIIRRESEEMPDFHWLKDGALPIPREEFVRRYLRAFHGVEDAFLFRHSSHSDWADIWVIVESVRPEGWDEDWTISREGAEDVVREWSEWAEGDCYGFESQTRTLTDAMCSDPSDPDDGWEDADACWGFIGDSGARYALSEALDMSEADVPAPYEVTAW